MSRVSPRPLSSLQRGARLGARIRQQPEQVTQEMTRLDRPHCGEGLNRQGDTAVRVAVFSNGARPGMTAESSAQSNWLCAVPRATH